MLAAGVGMGAFFWLPALYEQKYVVFNSITVSDPAAILYYFTKWYAFGIFRNYCSSRCIFPEETIW